MEFSYEEDEGKGHYGIEMVPKSCDDEENLLNDCDALRIVRIVAEIW
jgi:hypothetical protein